MKFILSQEVTSHIRRKACKVQEHNDTRSDASWNCSRCLFISDSQAECLFHEVLHDSPETQNVTVGDKTKILQKYTCPLCPKSFRKASLRQHLRQHTFERPFVCSICKANFTRQSSLNNHVRSDHGDNLHKTDKKVTVLGEVKEWKCNECSRVFCDK